MTLKEMFKKVETYNEIAELMRTYKTMISFYDCGAYHGQRVKSYDELRRWVRKEYIKEIADQILKCDTWEFDKAITFEWTDYFGYTYTSKFSPDLVAE